MSWDELEAIGRPPEDIREVQQAREDLARLTLRVFSNEDGKKLLEWLKAVYVDVPVAVPGADPSHAFYAEGCRSVVRDIEARINQARKL
jgi:hypothetical protein